MAKKGRFAHYRTNEKLPNNHQWVPVSVWKIAQVTPAPKPLSRAHRCVFAMRHKRIDYRLAAIDYEHPEGSTPQPTASQAISPPNTKVPPRTRLRRPIVPRVKKEKKPTEEDATSGHSASLGLIENLQHRFLTLFLSLSPTDQQALLDNFLVHNFAVWNFDPDPDATAEMAEELPLADTHHDAFHALMDRLGRLAAYAQKNADAAPSGTAQTAPPPTSPTGDDEDFEDIFDNIFSDEDPLNNPEQQEIMQKFLEASISAILLLKKNE